MTLVMPFHPQSIDGLAELRRLVEEHQAQMGVPSVAQLLHEVETRVVEIHGEPPATPTWEEVLVSVEQRSAALKAIEPEQDTPTVETSGPRPVLPHMARQIITSGATAATVAQKA